MREKLFCEPIGYFHSVNVEKYMAGRQAELSLDTEGCIRMESGWNYEQALEDLADFERIWIIFWLHRNLTWKPKVMTPRGGVKRGVFATRSPHRPNPIGLSCVELLGIEGREIFVGKSDLLDGSPILDIKPYLNYADAFPGSRQGWAEGDVTPLDYVLEWSALALKQIAFIEGRSPIHLKDIVELRLRENPLPFPNHRIKLVEGDTYELAVKTWRLSYTIEAKHVKIQEIYSGYDLETLRGDKSSRWDDVPVHVDFSTSFNHRQM